MKKPEINRTVQLWLFRPCKRTRNCFFKCIFLGFEIPPEKLTMTEREEDADSLGLGVAGKGIKLTNEQIVANTIMFLLAGYETTSTTMGFTTQFLAR